MYISIDDRRKCVELSIKKFMASSRSIEELNNRLFPLQY